MQVLEALSESVQNGESNDAAELTLKALSVGVAPETILDEALVKAMGIIGDKFRDGEIFVPEMLIAARAMNRALEVLEPEMLKKSIKARGVFMIGTVKGDLHDIGKNLVGIMFKGAGFNVIDLGTDVPVEKFIEAAREHRPDIIGLSSLLTTTMNYMQTVVDGLRGSGILSKIIIGGAPVTSEYAATISADGYADNAATAVELGKKLLNNA
jgi:5-methyltetrahydrofolate--homocysteine methyltransferase